MGKIPNDIIKKKREEFKKEYENGYNQGIKDIDAMSPAEIESVSKADNERAQELFYDRHDNMEASNKYIEGWQHAIIDTYGKID